MKHDLRRSFDQILTQLDEIIDAYVGENHIIFVFDGSKRRGIQTLNLASLKQKIITIDFIESIS